MTARRWSLVFAIVVIAIVVWFLWGRGADSKATIAAPGAGSSLRTLETGTGVSAAPRAYRSSKDVRAVNADAKAPIIDEVKLEKSSVCEGEENLVEVKAHSPDADDEPFLHYMVGGASGSSVVVRGASELGVLDNIKVIAFGRNGVQTTVDLPRFEVRNCQVEHVLQLEFRLLPNRNAEFELTAHVNPIARSGPAFEPVRYVWTFGDGTTSETSVPVETHDYSHRAQDRISSTFLVGCVAYSQTNAMVAGRVGLELNNSAFENFAYKGVVKILADLEPRFPEYDARGVVTQKVKLWHSYSHAIHVTRLHRSVLVLGKPAREEEVSVDALGIATIAPGQVVESSAFHFNPATQGDAYSLEYYVEGTTDDGWPASGNFAVMKPPSAPTPTENTPVMDPLLKAKILRARELLNKPYVTDEDIWRLEREGLMKDLHVDPAPPTAPPPSPPRPPAPPR